jgi:3-hydroxybutyryl-CoA dehydrogenase
MELRQIKRVAVIGGGIMGHGFATVFAQNGYPVYLNDLSADILKNAAASIRANLGTLIEAGLVKKSAKEKILSRVILTADLAEAAGNADFVLEAITEKMDLKKELFQKLDRFAPSHAILASNTSALSITEIAAVTRRPEKTIIVHGINPPHIIPIVEIVRGEKTSDETADLAYRLMKKIGKVPIRVLKEAPGFLHNRLHLALYREALHCLETGIATPEDIDRVITAGYAFRGAQIGPIKVSDLGGLDTFWAVCRYLFPHLSDAKEPPAILTHLVESGKLGAKTGSGFYDYPPAVLKRTIKERDRRLLLQLKLFRSLQKKSR